MQIQWFHAPAAAIAIFVLVLAKYSWLLDGIGAFFPSRLSLSILCLSLSRLSLVALLYVSFVSPVVYLPDACVSFPCRPSAIIMKMRFQYCLQSPQPPRPTASCDVEDQWRESHWTASNRLAITVLATFDLGCSTSPAFCIILPSAVLGCVQIFGPVWIWFDKWFDKWFDIVWWVLSCSFHLRSFVLFGFSWPALVVRCRDVCTIWRGAKGAPSPLPARGVVDHRIRLGPLLALFDSVDSECVRLVWNGVITVDFCETNETNETNETTSKHEGSPTVRPTVVRQSSDSRPTVQGIRHKSGTVVFSNAAYRCYVPWQFNAAYSMFAPKIRLHQVRQRYMHVNVCSHKFRD